MSDVLLVLTSADRRGAEIEGVQLAGELAKRGLGVVVVALRPAAGDTGLDVVSIGTEPLALTTLRELRRRARDASIVIGYGSSTLPACSLALVATGVPFIYRSIGDPAYWLRGRLHRLRTRVLFRRPDHVVALWDGAARSIRDLHRVPVDRVSVIPNARSHVDLRPPSEDEKRVARSRLGLDNDDIVVAQIGALSSEKRVELGIATVGALPNAQLLIAGDGPTRADVALAASAHPGRVHVLGTIDDISSVLHAADVVLSTSRTEGMPGTLIEAALCGVPAVATDVGATCRTVGNGGIVLPVTSTPASFADAINTVMADHRTFSEKARAHAISNFSWEVVATSWHELIERL